MFADCERLFAGGESLFPDGELSFPVKDLDMFLEAPAFASWRRGLCFKAIQTILRVVSNDIIAWRQTLLSFGFMR